MREVLDNIIINIHWNIIFVICSIENYELQCEKESVNILPPIIDGNRIVELGYVINQILLIERTHTKRCTLGKLEIREEIRKCTGLVSKIVLSCNICSQIYSFVTENPNKNASEINLGSVWGTVATGSTYNHTCELLSCMNIPNMPQKQFQEYENNLGEVTYIELILQVPKL